MIKAAIKKITPGFVLYQWGKYNANKEKRRLANLREIIISYLKAIPPEDMTDEKQAVLEYLKCHPLLSIFPYSYTEKYKSEEVTVYLDAEKEMRYVLQDGKRLYFKKGWDEKQAQAYYNGLLLDQDALSPHHYETAGFSVAEGDVVVDAGVAEGNFALSVVERAKELYLFEPDNDWIAALEATFAPWRNKVHIVNSYVSDSYGDEGGG
jgi:hypothetical protein